MPPGGQVELRRLDWGGGLCLAPFGHPGCAWRAAPLDGALLSGLVDVRAALGKDGYCQMTLRTLVRASAEDGAGTAFSALLDLENYRWETTKVLNGPYLITARKACRSSPCGGIRAPLRVYVKN